MQGLLIGLVSFIIIGIFHPIVTKGEYYFSKKIWPLFLIVGVILLYFSYLNKDLFISAILAITGFTCLWSIHEIFEQEERVKRGWFPKNPKRNYEKKEN